MFPKELLHCPAITIAGPFRAHFKNRQLGGSQRRLEGHRRQSQEPEREQKHKSWFLGSERLLHGMSSPAIFLISLLRTGLPSGVSDLAPPPGKC